MIIAISVFQDLREIGVNLDRIKNGKPKDDEQSDAEHKQD